MVSLKRRTILVKMSTLGVALDFDDDEDDESHGIGDERNMVPKRGRIQCLEAARPSLLALK